MENRSTFFISISLTGLLILLTYCPFSVPAMDHFNPPLDRELFWYTVPPTGVNCSSNLSVGERVPRIGSRQSAYSLSRETNLKKTFPCVADPSGRNLAGVAACLDGPSDSLVRPNIGSHNTCHLYLGESGMPADYGSCHPHLLRISLSSLGRSGLTTPCCCIAWTLTA